MPEKPPKPPPDAGDNANTLVISFFLLIIGIGLPFYYNSTPGRLTAAILIGLVLFGVGAANFVYRYRKGKWLINFRTDDGRWD